MMTGRERILAMVEGRQPDSLPLMPITMMFAGDFVGAPYGLYARDFRTLAEGQMRVAEAFDFDYVSCISDPAREATDCGGATHFFDDQPPAMDEEHALLADKARLKDLVCPDPREGRMGDRVQAAAWLHERVGVKKMVEGWIEGPCAEAADLRGINRLMLDFYEDPAFVTDLFEFVTNMALTFARAQVEAGVELMGIGDAAASLVGPQVYEQFVWPYEKRLVDGLHEMGALVRMHICGNIRPLLPEIGKLGCDIVDLDSMVPVSEARAAMGPDQVLLGNLDPVAVVRNGTPEAIRASLAACHREAGPRYIVGAGCEIVRDTPHENVHALREYARAHAPFVTPGTNWMEQV